MLAVVVQACLCHWDVMGLMTKVVTAAARGVRGPLPLLSAPQPLRGAFAL